MSDFGLANFAATSASAGSKTGIGTLNWSAPEVFEDHYKPKPTADVWSLGMVIYEVTSRTVPFFGLSLPQIVKKHDTATLPDMAAVESGAPASVTALLRACLAVDPSERPSADEAHRSLSAAAAELRTPVRTPRVEEQLGAILSALEAQREQMELNHSETSEAVGQVNESAVSPDA